MQPFPRLARLTPRRCIIAEKVPPRLRFRDFFQPRQRPAVKDLAAFFTGGRTDIDDPIRVPDHIQLVLDNK